MDTPLYSRDKGNSQNSGFLKAKTDKSAGKLMPTVFWDARGIISTPITWKKDKR